VVEQHLVWQRAPFHQICSQQLPSHPTIANNSNPTPRRSAAPAPADEPATKDAGKSASTPKEHALTKKIVWKKK
jgi:hypothetical protein